MNKNLENPLEKHYTPKFLLEDLNSLVKEFAPNPTEFLENSAGAGFMIDYLKEQYPNTPIIAYDIYNETKREDIKECNYLKEKIDYKEGRIAFINPPFTKGLKFAYKSLEECDYCFAILSKNSLINIDYDKYYLLKAHYWKMVDFGSCKVDVILYALRKKKEGDTYE